MEEDREGSYRVNSQTTDETVRFILQQSPDADIPVAETPMSVNVLIAKATTPAEILKTIASERH